MHFDKADKPEPVSLNKDSAYCVICSAPNGNESRFPHILHNVMPKTNFTCKLLHHIVEYCQLPDELNHFQTVAMIWESLHIMFDILKTEPGDPESHLLEGAPEGSNHTKDYLWGYTAEQRDTYKFHAERFYQLFCMRYSFRNLTPYMLKFIDYAPLFMTTVTVQFPICHFQTEG